MLIVLLLLSYPIAWIYYKGMSPEKAHLPSYGKALAGLSVTSALITFSPFSFVSDTVNGAVLVFTFILLFLTGLLLDYKKHWTGIVIVSIGKFIMIAVLFLPVLFFTNPIYYSILFDLEGISAKSVTKVNNYRLEHYTKYSNFNYAGTHLIVIKKEIIPYLIAMEKGTVNLGVYDQSDLPEFKISVLHPEEQRWIEMSQTIYEVTDTTLIKKEYSLGDGSYSDVEIFNY